MTTIEAIVIGGSAGALEALLTIVPALPPEVWCPIVIVLHLPTARPSLLPAILSRACARPVHEAEDKEPLRADTIYVAPPDYHLLIERSRSLCLSVDERVHHSRPSIDILFESAAEAYGAAVVGVVLSGANEDGAEGLSRIHQAGGVAIVQAPATASSPMMPELAMRRVGPAARAVRLADIGALLTKLISPLRCGAETAR